MQSTVICFFSSSKLKYSRKIFFIQTKLDENNFTSHVWWALIKEIAPRAEEMAYKKEMVFVLEATTYTRIYGQQHLGKCLCVAGS